MKHLKKNFKSSNNDNLYVRISPIAAEIPLREVIAETEAKYFDLKDYDAVDEWCAQQFGPHPKRPDAWSRWWHKFEDSILFRDEKDYILFTLRWS